MSSYVFLRLMSQVLRFGSDGHEGLQGIAVLLDSASPHVWHRPKVRTCLRSALKVQNAETGLKHLHSHTAKDVVHQH